MKSDEWLKDRVAYLQGLKSRNEPQELLVLLAEKPNRTAQDDKKLNAIVKAEKASLRASKARQDVANLINAEKKAIAKAERAARTHELCNSAGLLILAGLVDSKTGKPTLDKGELLGALLGLAKVPNDDVRRTDWKRAGDALLTKV
jgi:Conjugal transfer protein TraD